MSSNIDHTDLFTVLESLEMASGSNAKLQTLTSALQSGNKNLERFLRIAMNDDVYNISDKSIIKALGIYSVPKMSDIGLVVEYHRGHQMQTGGCSFEDFRDLADTLLIESGADAKIELGRFFRNCFPKEAKWYARAMVKDLRIGMTYVSINKAFSSLGKKPIFKFETKLCSLISIHDLDKVNFPLASETKYDGMRMVVRTFPNKSAIAISRNGKQILNANDILVEADKIADGKIYEFDGEWIATGGYNELMTQAHRKHDKSSKIQRLYMVFDLTVDDGLSIANLPFSERRRRLEKIVQGSDIVVCIPSKTVNTPEEVAADFNALVEAGEEGIILKETDSTYTPDRKCWYKIKPIKENTFIIRDMKYGTGRNKDLVSILAIEDLTGHIVSDVGTGFSDADRETLTKDKDTLKGQLVEVAYDNLTPINEKGIRSLRFPRFLKFRYDIKQADDLR